MTTQVTDRMPRRIVFGLIVGSLLVGGAMMVGVSPAAADITTVEADEEVVVDGETTITVELDEAGDEIRIEGDTAGWTVMDTDPEPDSLLSNPVSDDLDDGGYMTLAGEDWWHGNVDDQLTVSLTATVETGVYEFTALQRGDDGTVVDEAEFSIEVIEPSLDVAAPESVPENRSADITVSLPESTMAADTDTEVDEFRIKGDTAGWSVTDMSPGAATFSNPQDGEIGDEGYVTPADEDWWHAGVDDKLTVSVVATVETGTYDFTAVQRADDGEVIAEEPFSVEVTEAHESGVDENLANNIAEEQELNTEDPDDWNLGDVRTVVNEWDGNSVYDSDATLTDLRKLVNWSL